MEVDVLHGGETEEDDACECAALQDQGFQGPCYFCQRRGHMLRNCPRKAAGLPKIVPLGSGGGGNFRSNGGSGNKVPFRGQAPPARRYENGNSRPGYQNKKPVGQAGQRRLNSLDPHSPETTIPEAEEYDQEAACEEETVDFLEELFL